MTSNAASKIGAQTSSGRNGPIPEQIAGALAEEQVLYEKKTKAGIHMDSNIDAMIDNDHCIDEAPPTRKETKEGESARTPQPLSNHSKKGSLKDADVLLPVETAQARGKTNAGPPNMIQHNIERGFTSQSEVMDGSDAGNREQMEECAGGGCPNIVSLTTLRRGEHLLTVAPGAFSIYPSRHTTASNDNSFDDEQDQQQRDTAPSGVSNGESRQLQYVPEATMIQETLIVLAVKQPLNGAEDGLPSRRCSRGCLLTSGSMLLLGVAAIVSVAIVAAKNTNLPSSADVSGPPLIFTLAPSRAPTSPPSTSSEPSLSPSNSFETDFVRLVQSQSPETHFVSNDVAAALDWIVNDPCSLALEEDNDDRLLQRFALATVWFALGLDASSTQAALEEWLQPIDECDWNGRSNAPTPQCNLDGFVVRLDLGDHALAGSIPIELLLLSHLKHFGLQTITTNSLTGMIPSQLALLTSLETLRVGHGAMIGTIPSELWTSLTNLEWLRIDSNPGMSPSSIPSDVSSLSRLTSLSLYEVELSGSIPMEVGALTALVELDISYIEGLTGSIPTTVGLLSQLSRLNLQGNGLTGPIPTEIGLLLSLEHLWLDGNTLTGALPTELDLLTSLTTLWY